MKNIKLKFLRALSLLLASLFIINPFGTPIYAATSEVTEQPQKIIENNTDGDNIITNSDVGPLSSHTPALFNNSEIEKLTEYAIGGVFALASFAAISLAVLLPSSPDKFFNNFLDDHSDPNSLYIKMGGNPEHIKEYKQFLNAHSKQVEETYKVFNSSLCGATSLDKRELNVISCLRDRFPCNRLTEDQKKLIVRVVYCWLSLPGPKPETFCGQDIFILLPVYEKFITQTKELNQDDEAKVCYIFSKFMATSEKCKDKLRSRGRYSYFESLTFWPEIPERDRVYPDKLINQYINDPLPSLPADMWFTRLGGTQREIDAYNDAKSNLPKEDHAFDEFLGTWCVNENEYQGSVLPYALINRDLIRTYINGKSVGINDTHSKERAVTPDCAKQIKRILYIYYMHFAPDDKQHEYVQGETDILAMVYSKFLGHDDGILTDDDEAKMCYVFSQLMLVKNKFDIALKNRDSDRFLESYIDTFSSNLTSKEDRMQWFSLISAVVKAYCNSSDLLVAPVQTLGLRLFKDEGAMKMWDHIIMDNSMFSEGHLNYDKFFSTIVNLTLSLLLERSKNIDLNNLAALASLLNFNS